MAQILALFLALLAFPQSPLASPFQGRRQLGEAPLQRRALGGGPLGSLATFLWGGNNQFKKLVEFLEENGFSTFMGLIHEHDLDRQIREAVKRGTKITVLAPSNEAFNNLPNCNLDTDNTLLNHFIPIYVPGKCLYAAPIGSKFPTFGRDSIIKASNDPLVIRLKGGIQPRNGLFADVYNNNPSQDNDNQAIGNQGNGFNSDNRVNVTNVNNGNINNVNINGDNNNVQINNINNNNNVDNSDNTVCDYGGYDPTATGNDPVDGFNTVDAQIININIFKEQSIVVHHVDKVLALC